MLNKELLLIPSRNVQSMGWEITPAYKSGIQSVGYISEFMGRCIPLTNTTPTIIQLVTYTAWPNTSSQNYYDFEERVQGRLIRPDKNMVWLLYHDDYIPQPDDQAIFTRQDAGKTITLYYEPGLQ